MSISSKLSVIIISHQRYHLLKQAVHSVSAQSLIPDEIVLVDDGYVLPLAQQIAQDEEFPSNVSLTIVRLENLGPAAARNAGARRATGEILAFLDDDDLWHKNYLRCSLVEMKSRDASFTVSGLTCFSGNREWPGRQLPNDLSQQDLYASNLGFVGSNFVIYQSAFNMVGGFDDSLLGSEDKDLLIRLNEARVPYAVLSEPMVYYRVHPKSQASGRKNFHPLQVYGKSAFYKKYKNFMPVTTRCWLFAQSKYFLLRGGEHISERLIAGIFLCLVLPLVTILHGLRIIRQKAW